MTDQASERKVQITLRVTAADKRRLEQAAGIQYSSLSGFVVRTALAEAERVIEAAHVIKLSARETDWMLELLDAPLVPNERLRRAAAGSPRIIQTNSTE